VDDRPNRRTALERRLLSARASSLLGAHAGAVVASAASHFDMWYDVVEAESLEWNVGGREGWKIDCRSVGCNDCKKIQLLELLYTLACSWSYVAMDPDMSW
jgi:hypothetical protein